MCFIEVRRVGNVPHFHAAPLMGFVTHFPFNLGNPAFPPDAFARSHRSISDGLNASEIDLHEIKAMSYSS